MSISTLKRVTLCLRYAIIRFLLGQMLAALIVCPVYSSTGPQPEATAAVAKGAVRAGALSYQRIDDGLEDLEPGPHTPSTLKDLSAVIRQHANGLIWIGITFLATALSAVCVVKLNTRLSAMNSELLKEVGKRKTIEAGLLESDFYLRSALSAANEANHSKTEFLANMSHELRTPMNGIIGMTSILQNSNLTDEQAEFSNIIMKTSEGLMRIINDILDYSHIEAGQSKLESMDFDFYSMISSMVKNISPMAEEKKLIFSHRVDDDVPAYLKGDARRIRKIIRILMSNAVKFTHRGTVSLHVSLVQDGDTHATLRIEVKDTGIGIAADHLEQIFNPFSQVDYSTTRKYGGAGLGLALAKHFAEMMGSRIEVKSAPAEGTAFWFAPRLEKQQAEPLPTPQNTLNL